MLYNQQQEYLMMILEMDIPPFTSYLGWVFKILTLWIAMVKSNISMVVHKIAIGF